MERLDSYLQEVEIKPALFDFSVATNDTRIPLQTDQKLEEFPVSEYVASSSGLVAFAPPSQNWNPWRGINIDEAPLATMSLPDISSDLLAREKAKNFSSDILEKRRCLPVFTHKEEILKLVENNTVTLIKGTTGCGKSTQVSYSFMFYYITSLGMSIFIG